MNNDFLCDAPRFIDFSSQLESEDTAHVESYFDIDHEQNEVIQLDHAEKFQNSPEQIIEKDSLGKEVKYDLSNRFYHSKGKVRRSLSTGNLHKVNGQQVIIEHGSDTENSHSSTNNKSGLFRCASKNNLYNLAKPKIINAHAPKFVSMAEAINQYYKKTPDRFHSKNYKNNNTYNNTLMKKPVIGTIPNSPCLKTKQRVRAVHIPSQKELDEKELEEAKKFKIKANPINPKIFQGPVKPVLIKKPTTVVEPFKLTETVPKLNVQEVQPFEFHAKPVPKSVYSTPRNIKGKKETRSLPKSLRDTNGIKRQSVNAVKDSANAVKLFVPTKTQPMPFSFEQRDKELLKKKEEFINKVLEEEKKAREFHAKPPPKYLNTKHCNETAMTIKSDKSDEDVHFAMPTFKARPPSVLYKKPFEPKKAENTLIEITEFELNTQRRAKARQEFEIEMRKKEEEKEILKKQAIERQQELEKQQITELRKKAEYKANPVRHYKELKIVSSLKVTTPISPALHTAKNKENVN